MSQDELGAVDEYDDADMDVYDLPGNGLICEGPPTGLEKIYDYEPGGYHPVHLGDTLHDRYRVIHKLGSGGYSNVWLCCDDSGGKPRYVAVKIIMAEASTLECPELRVSRLIDIGIDAEAAARHFCLPLDQFSIDGPNGTHHALVYPVLGPRVSKLFNKGHDDDMDITLRKVAFQVTQAMSILHTHGICHGDFRPANILTRTSNLDDLSEEELLRLVGEPEKAGLVTASEEKHDLPTAPQYLVYPIRWEDIAQDSSAGRFFTAESCIIDFGESFEILNPPPELGMPQSYCPPEFVLDKKVSASCDIWALACTIFEIRTGRRLINPFDDDIDEHLCKMAMVLGKLPEPWWSETWEARRRFFVDEADLDGKVIKADREGHPLPEDRAFYQKPETRSIREAIGEGLFYSFRLKPGGIYKNISEAEIDCLSDLLEKMLKYNPDERLRITDALEHPWFKM
ncbi:kinase-like domain-containing protein [Xylaria curta]|nr:kinase-like domain-containing protein [Xylaria curta]